MPTETRVLCLKNRWKPWHAPYDHLIATRSYVRVADPIAEAADLWAIRDESGETVVYPKEWFRVLETGQPWPLRCRVLGHDVAWDEPPGVTAACRHCGREFLWGDGPASWGDRRRAQLRQLRWRLDAWWQRLQPWVCEVRGHRLDPDAAEFGGIDHCLRCGVERHGASLPATLHHRVRQSGWQLGWRLAADLVRLRSWCRCPDCGGLCGYHAEDCRPF